MHVSTGGGGGGGGQINRVLILGGGSAGFLAAITLKSKLPELAVRVFRSKEIPIIGVGEGTTPVVPLHLHGYLNLDLGEFYRLARPIWKLGIRFLGWGPRSSFDYTFNHQVDWQWEQLPRPNGFYCGERFENASIASALMAFNRAFMRQPDGTPVIARDVA